MGRLAVTNKTCDAPSQAIYFEHVLEDPPLGIIKMINNRLSIHGADRK